MCVVDNVATQDVVRSRDGVEFLSSDLDKEVVVKSLLDHLIILDNEVSTLSELSLNRSDSLQRILFTIIVFIDCPILHKVVMNAPSISGDESGYDLFLRFSIVIDLRKIFCSEVLKDSIEYLL